MWTADWVCLRELLGYKEKMADPLARPFKFIYQDECGEPSKNQDHFLIGLLRVKDRNPLYAAINEVREKNHFVNEIKFQEMSNLRLKVYLEVLNRVATLKHEFSFSAIAIHRDKLDMARFSGQKHKAYNFFTHMLLSKRLQNVDNAVVYVDSKTRMKEDNFLSYLETWTNLRAMKQVVKTVEPICSKTDDLIQLTDLFLGCCNTYLGHPNGDRKKLVLAEALKLQLISSSTIWKWEPRQ